MNERDTKLLQWLGEAHDKEAELEGDLTAHIAVTEKRSYKQQLQQHLKETRAHKRLVARRIKELGGSAPDGGPSVPGVPVAAGEIAGKAVAAVKGQIGAIRAAATDQIETHIRNAHEELREEHVEIALYKRIETFADAVGDRETARTARGIRRQEERMARYLDGELERLVKQLVRSEVPPDQRANGGRRRRATTASKGRATRTRGQDRRRTRASR